MSIGEPRHAPPPFVLEALRANLRGSAAIPTTAGCPSCALRAPRWLDAALQLPPGAVDPETMVLPVNGTREALFAFVQAVVDRRARRRWS